MCCCVLCVGVCFLFVLFWLARACDVMVCVYVLLRLCWFIGLVRVWFGLVWCGWLGLVWCWLWFRCVLRCCVGFCWFAVRLFVVYF